MLLSSTRSLVSWFEAKFIRVISQHLSFCSALALRDRTKQIQRPQEKLLTKSKSNTPDEDSCVAKYLLGPLASVHFYRLIFSKFLCTSIVWKCLESKRKKSKYSSNENLGLSSSFLWASSILQFNESCKQRWKIKNRWFATANREPTVAFSRACHWSRLPPTLFSALSNGFTFSRAWEWSQVFNFFDTRYVLPAFANNHVLPHMPTVFYACFGLHICLVCCIFWNPKGLILIMAVSSRNEET